MCGVNVRQAVHRCVHLCFVNGEIPNVFRIDGVQLRFIAFGLAGSSF